MTSLRLYCTSRMWEVFGDRIRAISPDVQPLLAGAGEGFDPADIDIAYFSPDLWTAGFDEFEATCRAASNLRWLHTASAGIDYPFFADMIDRGVALTTSSGAAARPIAHSALMMMLALSRDLPRWIRAQAERRWSPHRFDDLDGSVLGIVGFGPIGQELAGAADALGMDVRICRRTKDPADRRPTVTSLAELAPEVDWLVLAAPLTEDTRHMLDDSVLRTMKPSARVVNVGRGALIEEDALVDALQSGRLAGAALDVFTVEPLPPDHPLWDLPNVIITPHNTGASPGSARRMSEMFLDNLARLTDGRPMLNLVQRS